MTDIKEILKGIDREQYNCHDGWWETSGGAEFGAGKLAEVDNYANQLKAQVERLRGFVIRSHESIEKYPFELHENAQKMRTLLNETPAQSLAEHDAALLEDLLKSHRIAWAENSGISLLCHVVNEIHRIRQDAKK